VRLDVKACALNLFIAFELIFLPLAVCSTTIVLLARLTETDRCLYRGKCITATKQEGTCAPHSTMCCSCLDTGRCTEPWCTFAPLECPELCCCCKALCCCAWNP
jgi:hypothetical protein